MGQNDVDSLGVNAESSPLQDLEGAEALADAIHMTSDIIADILDHKKPEFLKNKTETLEAWHVDALSLLIDRSVIMDFEVNHIKPSRIEELILLSSRDFSNMPIEVPEHKKKKGRRILGLQENPQDGPINKEERIKDIGFHVTEMQEYLMNFKSECPELTGCILYGSRVDPSKKPSEESDADIVLIFKNGTKIDESESGKSNLDKYQKYIKKNKTRTGIEVDLDGLYTEDELVHKLKGKIDENILRWGWNPLVPFYVGNSFNVFSQKELNIWIKEKLLSETIKARKNAKIIKARLEAGMMDFNRSYGMNI